MKTLNTLINYLCLILIAVLIGTIIALLKRLSKTKIVVSQTVDNAKGIGTGIEAASDKISVIRDSSDSWKFFLSVIAVFAILKETIKYLGSEKSLTKSFAKACFRHSSQIRFR